MPFLGVGPLLGSRPSSGPFLGPGGTQKLCKMEAASKSVRTLVKCKCIQKCEQFFCFSLGFALSSSLGQISLREGVECFFSGSRPLLGSRAFFGPCLVTLFSSAPFLGFWAFSWAPVTVRNLFWSFWASSAAFLGPGPLPCLF